MQNSNKKIGIIVKNYRKLKNLSTQELAESLDVSVGFVSNLEHDKNDVFKLDLLMKLLNILDIPIADLLPYNHAELKEICLNGQLQKVEISLPSSSINNIEQIQQSLKDISIAFIDVLERFNFESSFVSSISEHILQELSFIKEIGQI